ncbi:hypothetical protein [Agrobacterium tumefaciens]|uniref:hypothetical protein n=1 Tax=Agrobacterium tumefaciens TaxID=358 RepID=UPI0015720E35|nr:hypothetical protein [Agrobacterium tumefaciens]
MTVKILTKVRDELLPWLAAVAIGVWCGHLYESGRIAGQCRNFGSAEIDGAIYNCQPEGPKQVARRVVI